MTAPMWMTDCPTEETLAAFIDDRLDAATRRKVTEHLTDCAECRELVLMASEYKAAKTDPVPISLPVSRFRRWLFPAAALATAAVLAVYVGQPMLFGPGLDDVRVAFQPLKERSFAGRLASFPYRKQVRIYRNATQPISVDQMMEMEPLNRVAASVQEAKFPDPHVAGVTGFLTATNQQQRDVAVNKLELAHSNAKDTDRDLISIDLATALLARGSHLDEKHAGQDYVRALSLSTEVYQRTKRPEAAWNRAVALESLNRDADAIRAWDDYLKLDSTSEWANDAVDHKRKLEP